MNYITITLMVNGKTMLEDFKAVYICNYSKDEIEIGYADKSTQTTGKLKTKRIDVWGKDARYIIHDIGGRTIAVIQTPKCE